MNRRGISALAAATLMAGAVWVGPAVAGTASAAPPSPEDITAILKDGNKVSVDWTASDAADLAYYRVFRYANGSTPVANELTYIGKVDKSETDFEDTLLAEGEFHYTVMAVDEEGNLSQVEEWAKVTADCDGDHEVEPDTVKPEAPTDVEADFEYTRNRKVTLTWSDSAAGDIWRYVIYRTDGEGTRQAIGYVEPGVEYYIDEVPAENQYIYHVVAQDTTGNASDLSEAVKVYVDGTAPTIEVLEPVANGVYGKLDELTVKAKITDAVAGVDYQKAVYYLDGKVLDSFTVDLKKLDEGLHSVEVKAVDKAGNESTAKVYFLIGEATDEGDAPKDLTVDRYSKTDDVELDWKKPDDTSNLQHYAVYRISDKGAKLVGTTEETEYTDKNVADGHYTYYVAAVYDSGIQISNVVMTTVDTTAPRIRIAAPADEKEYEADEALDIKVDITDVTSGFDPDDVEYFLDGAEYSKDVIDLAKLQLDKAHTFEVAVVDRAGNKATKSVEFTVIAPVEGNEDEEEDETQPVQYQELIDLLISLRSEIHHGHFNALMAKLRAGNLEGFRDHIIRHEGKFISPNAAEKLLKALSQYVGEDAAEAVANDDDDDNDDQDHTYVKQKNEKPGNGKGKGNGKK